MASYDFLKSIPIFGSRNQEKKKKVGTTMAEMAEKYHTQLTRYKPSLMEERDADRPPDMRREYMDLDERAVTSRDYATYKELTRIKLEEARVRDRERQRVKLSNYGKMYGMNPDFSEIEKRVSSRFSDPDMEIDFILRRLQGMQLDRIRFIILQGIGLPITSDYNIVDTIRALSNYDRSRLTAYLTSRRYHADIVSYENDNKQPSLEDNEGRCNDIWEDQWEL